MHMLILWLSFDWLLKAKKFKSNWNRILFSAIPLIGEIGVITVLFYENSISPSGLVKLFDNLFFFSILLLALIEFMILISIYSNYLARIENTVEA
jgi:hypothetical protein